MAWPNVLMETQLVKLSLPVLFENFIVLSKTLCTSLCDPHGGPGSIDPVNTSCRARHTCPSSPQVFYLFSPKKKKENIIKIGRGVTGRLLIQLVENGNSRNRGGGV